MITLMHMSFFRALTSIDAAILDRTGQNQRAAYAAADRRDAQFMYARTDATGERNDDIAPARTRVDS